MIGLMSHACAAERGAVHQHRQRGAGDEHAVRGRVAQQAEERVHQVDCSCTVPQRMRI